MKRNRLRAEVPAFCLALCLVFQGCSLMKPKQCRNDKYVPAMQEQALSFYNQGELIQALKILKDAEECNPKDPSFYYLIGIIYYKRGKPHDAIEYFKKSIRADGEYTEARVALGVVYLSLNQWDDAIREFEISSRDDFFTRPWEVYNNLAWAYMQKGEYELAEMNANKAIKENKDFCMAYANLGEINSRMGNKREAVVNYNRSIKLCGKTQARPHFLMGLALGEMNYVERACEEFNTAARMGESKESEQAREYMRLYNCPGVLQVPSGY